MRMIQKRKTDDAGERGDDCRSKLFEQVRRDGVHYKRRWTRIEADSSSILVKGKAQHTAADARRLVVLLVGGCTDSLPTAFIF